MSTAVVAGETYLRVPNFAVASDPYGSTCEGCAFTTESYDHSCKVANSQHTDRCVQSIWIADTDKAKVAYITRRMGV